LPHLQIGRAFITGKSGSGKSNTAGIVVEGILDAGYDVCIVDTDQQTSAQQRIAPLKEMKTSQAARDKCGYLLGPPRDNISLQHLEGILQKDRQHLFIL
jgi:CO dehydrogenase nickel-insertion accessory protein CooC1